MDWRFTVNLQHGLTASMCLVCVCVCVAVIAEANTETFHSVIEIAPHSFTGLLFCVFMRPLFISLLILILY